MAELKDVIYQVLQLKGASALKDSHILSACISDLAPLELDQQVKMLTNNLNPQICDLLFQGAMGDQSTLKEKIGKIELILQDDHGLSRKNTKLISDSFYEAICKNKGFQVTEIIYQADNQVITKEIKSNEIENKEIKQDQAEFVIEQVEEETEEEVEVEGKVEVVNKPRGVVLTGEIVFPVKMEIAGVPYGSKENPIEVFVWMDELIKGGKKVKKIKELRKFVEQDDTNQSDEDLEIEIPLGVYNNELVEIIIPEKNIDVYGYVRVVPRILEKHFTVLDIIVGWVFIGTLLAPVVLDIIERIWKSPNMLISRWVQPIGFICVAIYIISGIWQDPTKEGKRVDKAKTEAIKEYEQQYCKDRNIHANDN